MQGGTGHNLVCQDAVPERANPTVPLRSLKIAKNAFSKRKLGKIRITNVPAMLGAKMRPSREGSNLTVPLRSLKIYKNTFSKRNDQKMSFANVRRILGAKMGPSQDVAKSTVPLRFFKISLLF